MGKCSSCGAEGNKGCSKAACPAQGKVCYNCGIQGHFGRACTTQSNLLLVMNGGQSKQISQNECLGCRARGARMHARDACPAQDKDCHHCGVSGHFERVCRRKSRWSPRKILTPIPKTSRQSTTHTGVVEEKDDPKTSVRPLVGGNGVDQLTTSFRGLVSEGRGSKTFAFGVADCQDGVTGHKTEREAFSTNIWPHLGGGVWRLGMTTADDKYAFHCESTLPEVHYRRCTTGGNMVHESAEN
jgi:hypothetical protein